MHRASPTTRQPGGAPARAWLRALLDAAVEDLVVTTYLLAPLLVRTPSGCAPALPLVSAPPSEHLPTWLDRWVVRLCRLSAWRYARPAGASAISELFPASRTSEPVPPPPFAPSGAQRDNRGASGVGDRAWAATSTSTTHGTEPDVPIDVVYTWVDDNDPAWRARYATALARSGRDGRNEESVSRARFHNREELRYSLRSLARHAPFVRRVYLVTAGQVPSWLDGEAPDIEVVPHDAILDPGCLPTFNSHAIESALHRIDGLAEHYLYLNDDFFFGRTCSASMFFTADGQPKLFPDQGAMVPDGPCSPADRAVDSASKNTRDIMANEFGYPVKYKMQHVPYPQRRSVLYEMEQRYPEVFARTAGNPFRHHTDVNIPSCFSHYYAFVTGAAVTGQIPAAYVNIGNPWARATMRRLLQRADRDVFCLNDGPMGARRRPGVDATVRWFLEAYFPEPAPFERPPPPYALTDRAASS